jgi:hypothetical protein
VMSYIGATLVASSPGCEISSPCFLTMSRYLQPQPFHHQRSPG